MDDIEVPPFLTAQECAPWFRCSPATVTRWAKAGRIKSVRVGRKILVPHSEVLRVLGGVENVVVRQVQGGHDAA